MTNTNAIPQNIQSALAEYDSTDLITALIHKHNQEADDLDKLLGDNKRLEQQRDGYKRQNSVQLDEIEALKQANQALERENSRCVAMVKEAEAIAQKSIAIQNQNHTLKSQVQSLQNEVREMKQAGDPKKLKTTIAEKNAKLKDLEKSKSKLQQSVKHEQHQRSQLQVSLNQAIDKIAQLQKQLAHDTGAGLYHNKDHHLIIWPQATKMQSEDGSIIEGRSLLYLHQSGRGGLMSYNQETNEVNLCAAPKGGLRPSEDTREFAKNWLFKVNALQGGIVQDDDMIPVNYNVGEA